MPTHAQIPPKENTFTQQKFLQYNSNNRANRSNKRFSLNKTIPPITSTSYKILQNMNAEAFQKHKRNGALPVINNDSKPLKNIVKLFLKQKKL
ncbi:hypothetical protein WN51_10586 [Melipona quadrifasciata]|uniref:Uncharacterized protein n=1 Tax=Melipona quadrifasciata TaxID=166423 RepID=A0A0M9A731_9HYME|nr:hypothetical protein WN51_10586 [Melipona quadrifasciata]